MVSFWRINYSFQKGGISSLAFVSGIWVWMWSLQFCSRCKYQPRLFECRKHVVYTIGRLKWQTATHTRISKGNATGEGRQMLLRGKSLSPNILRVIVTFNFKFIKLWIRNLSTTVFFFDSSHKIFLSINHVTHRAEAYSEPCQISQMRLFAKLFLLLTIFAKCSILDV